METRMEYPMITLIPPNQGEATLMERGGSRVITLPLSGMSLALLLWELQDTPARPEIFKFVSECIGALKGSMKKVVIYDVTADGVYRSHIVISDDRDDRTYQLELHVTDALVLAVAVKCPIFVTEETFAKRDKYRSEHKNEISDEAAKRIFDSMDPDKLTKN